MSADQTFVIVGASHAGGRAAQSLRMAGFEGRVVLIGEEDYLPYERPPLSKQLLMSDDGIERAELNPRSYYDENSIELMLGCRAERIDPHGRTVTCSKSGAGGEEIAWDRLMITTGARVRTLPVPGADLDGVHYLRDFNDTQVIRGKLKAGAKTVVIGGGFIGLEAAAGARTYDCDVTVIEAADRLMGRAVAPEIGAYYADLHRSHGVDLKLETGVEAIEGGGPENGMATGVKLSTGDIVPADLVIVGIGIVPNTELAADAGLEVDNGIVVDEFGRTSDPNIFAAGDVCNQPHELLGERVRLESYQNAQDQGMAVARNMMSGDDNTLTAYNDRLWVWTDQYDVNLQMAGMPRDYDRLVWRGDKADGAFTLFYMKGARVRCVNTVNNGKDMRIAERMLAADRDFDDAALADTETQLRQIMKG